MTLTGDKIKGKLFISRGYPGDNRYSVPAHTGDGSERTHQSEGKEEHRHGAREAAAAETGGTDGQGRFRRGRRGTVASPDEASQELFPQLGQDSCEGKGSTINASSR